MQKNLVRGKVDCFIKFKLNTAAEAEISVNQELVASLLSAAKEIGSLGAASDGLSAEKILSWPNVLQYQEQNAEVLIQPVQEMFAQALEDLAHARAKEGEKLSQQLLSLVEALRQEVAKATDLG